MPYIKHDRRADLSLEGSLIPDTSGELNYMLTELVLRYIGDAPNYTMFNNAIGALECCKLELYRRMVAPYEDTKIIENGDVY